MDSIGLIALCIQLASRELGLPEPTDADAKHIIGSGAHDSSRILFPDMLLKLMAIAGLDKERVLMIGDTTHDLDLAANAGVRSVAVSYGAHPESELLRHEPVKCFQSVNALHAWLTQNV